METIQPGKFVEITYDLYEKAPHNQEILVHQVDDEQPEQFIFGVTPGMVRPLEKALENLHAGDKFDITVKAADAFGDYDPEQVVELPKEIFEVDGKFDSDVIKPGAYVPMMTQDGHRLNGRVLDITAEEVKMDFNHPLAGKDVRINGAVKLVRDATPEELSPAQGCGCGCSSCGDESCCGDESHHHDNGSCCGCH